MSETVNIPARSAGKIRTKLQGINVDIVMTIDDMKVAVHNISAVMPGDVWEKLIVEINGDGEICENCGTAIPGGCGGIFR